MGTTYFERAKWYFDNGYATSEGLKVWVEKGKITDVEYKTITGIDYVV